LRCWIWEDVVSAATTAAATAATAAASSSASTSAVITATPITLHLAPIFSLQTPQARGAYQSLAPLSESNAVLALPSGAVLTASGDGCIYSWDVSRGEIVSKFRTHASSVYHLQSVAGGSLVASSGSATLGVQLWDIRTDPRTAVAELGGGGGVSDSTTAFATCLTSDSAGLLVARGSSAGRVDVFHASSRSRIASFALDEGQVANTALFRGTDERTLAVGLNAARVEFCRTQTGARLPCVRTAAPTVNVLHALSDGAMLVAGRGKVVEVVTDPLLRPQAFSLV
jgi:WD40 repeat protein